MLEISNVTKTFHARTVNERIALNNVSLHLDDRDFVTVIGGNGAGKSTLLNAIAGVWPVESGRIVIDGTDITGMHEHRRAALLGRVFQDPMMGTAATMQIEENLALAARRGQKRTLKAGITREERERYREQLAELGLGLENRMTAKVGLLSGGQRQALTLLMATYHVPQVLLLDEPTAHLDVENRIDVLRTLREVARKTGTAVLFSSHDLHDALQVADRVFALTRDGRFLASAGTDVLRAAFPALANLL